MPQSATTYPAYTNHVNEPIQAKPTPAWMDINAWRQIQGRFAINRDSMSDAELKKFENFCKKNNISFTQKLSNKNGQIIEITNNSNLFKNLLKTNSPQLGAQQTQHTPKTSAIQKKVIPSVPPLKEASSQTNSRNFFKQVNSKIPSVRPLEKPILSPDNYLYNASSWRETNGGELYYDLGKEYHPQDPSNLEKVLNKNNIKFDKVTIAHSNGTVTEAYRVHTTAKNMKNIRENEASSNIQQQQHSSLRNNLREKTEFKEWIQDHPQEKPYSPQSSSKTSFRFNTRDEANVFIEDLNNLGIKGSNAPTQHINANGTQEFLVNAPNSSESKFLYKTFQETSQLREFQREFNGFREIKVGNNFENFDRIKEILNHNRISFYDFRAPGNEYYIGVNLDETTAQILAERGVEIKPANKQEAMMIDAAKRKAHLSQSPQRPISFSSDVSYGYSFPGNSQIDSKAVAEVFMDRLEEMDIKHSTSTTRHINKNTSLTDVKVKNSPEAKKIYEDLYREVYGEKNLTPRKPPTANKSAPTQEITTANSTPNAHSAYNKTHIKAASQLEEKGIYSRGFKAPNGDYYVGVDINSSTAKILGKNGISTNNATPKPGTFLKTPQPAMASVYENFYSLQAAQPEIAATKTITPPEVVQPHTPQPTNATTKPPPTPNAPPLTRGWKQALSVAGKAAGTGLGLFGTFYEGTEAAQAFEKGNNLEGAYHTANTLAYGGATAGIFVSGALGAGMIKAGGVAGSIQLGVEAVKDAQKGNYSSAALEAAGAAYFGHATLSGSMFLSAGTAVSAAPVAVTAAAVAGSAALGWKAGRWIDSTYLEPARNYSMDVKDSAKLVGDRMKNVSLGEQPAYLVGFMNSFNDGFDAVSTGWSFKAQWNRLTTSNESRKNKLLEEIANNPQAAYEKGVKGLGGNKGIGANAFLIHESINAGAKPRGFNDLSATKNDIHPASKAVKSDISQTFYMNVSNNEEINDIAQAKTALFLIQNGAGYTADDLAEAARSNNELMTDALLLSVKDNQTGKVRMLYDMNDAQKWDYTPPTATEEFILPKEMRTPENMNTLMREAIKANEVTPFKVSAIQQAFNNEGQMKIAEDVLTETISNPQKHLSDSIEDKENAQEAVLSAICGNKEAGYRFHAWQITPAVVSAVKNLDPERKEAFIRYAQETNLGKDNPETQAALKELASTDETQAQNTQSTQKDETKSESPAPSQKDETKSESPAPSQKDEKDSAGKGDESNNNPSGKTVIERQGLGTKVNVDEAEQQPLERNNGATR